MGRMDRSKPLMMMKIQQDNGSVIPPKRAEKKTSPKMDMLSINVLQNRGHRYVGKSLRIRNFHILLHLT